MASTPLLSIAIPAYDRPKELEYGLEKFISQIANKYEDEIEIVIADDNSPNDSLRSIKETCSRHRFIRYVRYPQNIGLERNLIACSEKCQGKYLWIFGDDDFLETDDALDRIVALLRDARYDFFVLNRTRRSADLSKLTSPNWMQLEASQTFEFSGLREFCMTYGFISVIGFITANIFKRDAFQRIDAAKYFGTMYPQLGAMLQAFHNRPTLVVGQPLICHRTQTPEEKRAALGTKKTEADFMADATRRNAIYFSLPYINMLSDLIAHGCFTPHDIIAIPENTVINGLLIDFLIQTVCQRHAMKIEADRQLWVTAKKFFELLPLDADRRALIDAVIRLYVPEQVAAQLVVTSIPQRIDAQVPEMRISVISPSFNQAEFLGECLASVRDQTYKPLEHLVFDPGSKDHSREIAAGFEHVTLVAEPDKGQSDALNKGFKRARGDIIAWLNSDDCYAHPEVFERVVRRFLEPDQPDIIYGKGIYINEHGEKLRDVYINKDPHSLPWRFQHEDGIMQPALFMKRSVVERVGPLRNDLHYSMDYEYWIRCVKAGIKFAYLDENLAIARYHINNKTYGMRGNSYAEVCDVMMEHFAYVNHIWLARYAEFLADGHDGVLKTAASSGVKERPKLDRIYRDLLVNYNTGYDTYALLKSRANEKSYGLTFAEMQKLCIEPPVPCKPVPLETSSVPGFECYTVGTRRWAFDTKWKAAEISKSHEFLRRQMNARSSDTCVLVEAGASLSQTNFALLKGTDTIISGSAFLNRDVLQHATYYTEVNHRAAEQRSHQINRLEKVQKVLPYWLSYCVNPSSNTHFVDSVGLSEFSRDIFKNISWRHAVAFFNLQLAYGLGYRRVILIGFDHNFEEMKGLAQQKNATGYEADVEMIEAMFRSAKDAFDADSREIINATVGGKLELFPRRSLTDLVNRCV